MKRSRKALSSKDASEHQVIVASRILGCTLRLLRLLGAFWGRVWALGARYIQLCIQINMCITLYSTAYGLFSKLWTHVAPFWLEYILRHRISRSTQRDHNFRNYPYHKHHDYGAKSEEESEDGLVACTSGPLCACRQHRTNDKNGLEQNACTKPTQSNCCSTPYA